MVPVRNRTFESKENAEMAFSRLDWKVEKVKRLTNPLLNNSTTDTVRPWVGKIDRAKKEFEIIQTAPYFSPRLFEGNFFQLFIHGQIIEEGFKSKIILKFKLGLMTSLLFVLIYLFPILPAVAYFTSNNGDDWTGIIFGLAVPTILTLLLIVQLNRTENNLIDLFEV